MLTTITTPIADLFVVDTSALQDKRGRFSRLFCQKTLAPLLKGNSVVQINQSHSNEIGTIRGLHFQSSPMQEMKLVRCTQGRVFDVAVDLRAHSDTFLQWYGEELSAENGKMMVIPEGFAHGFQVLEAHSEMLYLHTEFYAPEHEGGVLYHDPKIAINWPLACSEISEKDASFTPLSPNFARII